MLSKENRQETKLLNYINKNDNKTLVQKLSVVMDHQQTNQSWPHIFLHILSHLKSYSLLPLWLTCSFLLLLPMSFKISLYLFSYLWKETKLIINNWNYKTLPLLWFPKEGGGEERGVRGGGAWYNGRMKHLDNLSLCQCRCTSNNVKITLLTTNTV